MSDSGPLPEEPPPARSRGAPALRRWVTLGAALAAVAAIVLLVLMNRATAP